MHVRTFIETHINAWLVVIWMKNRKIVNVRNRSFEMSLFSRKTQHYSTFQQISLTHSSFFLFAGISSQKAKLLWVYFILKKKWVWLDQLLVISSSNILRIIFFPFRLKWCVSVCWLLSFCCCCYCHHHSFASNCNWPQAATANGNKWKKNI